MTRSVELSLDQESRRLLTMRASVRDLLNELSSGNNPAQVRERLAGTVLPGLDVPIRCGGGGATPREMLSWFIELGYIDLDLRDVAGMGHAGLLTHESTRRHDELLGSVAAGSSFFAILVTEPQAGSDLHGLCTIAIPDGCSYVLHGVKRYVARMAEATHCIVFAQVVRNDQKQLSVFLVPRKSEGLDIMPLASMGLNGVSWSEVYLNGIRVHQSARIGGEGQGFRLFLAHFTYWRLMMAGAAIGAGRAAIDVGIKRMRERFAFGGAIGRFSHLQLELARLTARLHHVYLGVVHAAERLTNHLPCVADAAMAKSEAVECAIRAVEWSMLLHGAAGYDRATGLDKRLRDLYGLRIADGTTDVLRGQVARSILGKQLYDSSLGRDSDSEDYGVETRRYW